ncbi:tRNA modification GTPase GTPBP3, mitochondrial [Cyphellophora attinorum]|uniref:tRNA modification GTPase GTPBP3, mitochondrial n=1 Tax=Cyphellophora attinorum TaxID=1664694 RepID=A0A0N1P002_9EURO|nr:tRNA modification GTPase GTPBP3, mitochondrial [Phialophora attinorum]KPI39157.1 tRNA modification GTPase GTPBP3, mitochondrial [Phialophora attinorum]
MLSCGYTVSLRRAALTGATRLASSGPYIRRWPTKNSFLAKRFAASLPFVRSKDLPTVDTIYALSTAPGRAAIAIIRVSGPACLDIYGALCPDKPFPTPRVATLRKLYTPRTGDHAAATVLDSGALVLYFPAPATVTGEDILELHVHGGPAIVRSILSAIPLSNPRDRRKPAHYSLIRPAEPGEFTKRAFYNGRISLPEAESLGSLLAAETEQQRRLAVLGAESGLAERYERWRQILLYARGELEALIDFSEDQHFDESPTELIASVSIQVRALQEQLRLHIQNASRGELLRSGIRVALLGAPNAGKSSLLNRIVGREAAIVSSEEGTTRDIVDVSVDLDGWPVRLGDMAGLRTTPTTSSATISSPSAAIGEIEKEGIRRARARALDSDVVIILLSLEANADGTVGLHLNDEVRAAAKECQSAGKTLVVAVNKADLIPGLATSETTKTAMRRYIYNTLPGLTSADIHFLSCRDSTTATLSSSPSATASTKSTTNETATYFPAFMTALTQTFAKLTSAAATTTSPSPDAHTASSTPEQLQITPQEAHSYYAASLSVTHRQKTARATGDIDRDVDDILARSSPPASSSQEDEGEVDIVAAAEHLRYAAAALAKLTGTQMGGDGSGGAGDVEDVLGVVFEK